MWSSGILFMGDVEMGTHFGPVLPYLVFSLPIPSLEKEATASSYKTSREKEETVWGQDGREE